MKQIDTTEQERQFRHEKTALKFYLIGRGYHRALKALGFIEKLNVGKTRKDNKTPALLHQIRIALAITQLKDLIDEERCLVAALLHDEQEDNGISTEELVAEFGQQAADDVWCLTKKYRGVNKELVAYIYQCSQNPAASIVKGCDRNNNLSTMFGVFTKAKMESYIAEAEELFLPMIKNASKLFPEQTQAYQAISQQMKQLIELMGQSIVLMN